VPLEREFDPDEQHGCSFWHITSGANQTPLGVLERGESTYPQTSWSEQAFRDNLV